MAAPSRSGRIAERVLTLAPQIDALLSVAASREARDAAPDDADAQREAGAEKSRAWQQRWTGLRGWFVADGVAPSQAELLRARARGRPALARYALGAPELRQATLLEDIG